MSTRCLLGQNDRTTIPEYPRHDMCDIRPREKADAKIRIPKPNDSCQLCPLQWQGQYFARTSAQPAAAKRDAVDTVVQLIAVIPALQSDHACFHSVPAEITGQQLQRLLRASATQVIDDECNPQRFSSRLPGDIWSINAVQRRPAPARRPAASFSNRAP